ncbi:hypothetical protein J4429_05855 [Candidatus Pacearchaeota archaeon]|nr:hypothetical protein [Candidatus Pacearchaeota archaeon]
MAYKRYFKRNGKIFGPYYYESYRDKNGKVKKRYIGRENPDENDNETKINTGFKENADFNDKMQKNDAKKLLNMVTPTNFNLKILIIMIAILILTDISFIIFYLR